MKRIVDRKSTRLNSSHANISYAVFCLKKKLNNPSSTLAESLTITKPINNITSTQPTCLNRSRKFMVMVTPTTPRNTSTLSLHDALPIYRPDRRRARAAAAAAASNQGDTAMKADPLTILLVEDDEENRRSEEHTSELQSRQYLVCRLLLEKKIEQPLEHSSRVVDDNEAN